MPFHTDQGVVPAGGPWRWRSYPKPKPNGPKGQWERCDKDDPNAKTGEKATTTSTSTTTKSKSDDVVAEKKISPDQVQKVDDDDDSDIGFVVLGIIGIVLVVAWLMREKMQIPPGGATEPVPQNDAPPSNVVSIAR